MKKHEEIADTFSTLSSPLRIRIIELLSRSQTSTGDIAKALGKQPATISTSLKGLRNKNMLTCYRKQNFAIYGLNKDNPYVQFILKLIKEK